MLSRLPEGLLDVFKKYEAEGIGHFISTPEPVVLTTKADTGESMASNAEMKTRK